MINPTNRYSCCVKCGCKFNGAHPDPISDEEEKLSIWKELIECNIIPYGDFLMAAKIHADGVRALKRQFANICAPKAKRKMKSAAGKRGGTH